MKSNFILILITVFSFSPTLAQYQVETSTFGNSAGTTNNSTYKVESTVGQTFIGTASGTGYEVKSGFWYGYMPPPPAHPSSFYVHGAGNNSLSITFDSPASTNNSGYLVLYRQGTLLTDVPTDNTTYSVGDDVGDSKVGGIITDDQQVTFSITGLQFQTGYTIRIVPFSGSDPNRDFLTTGDPATLTTSTIPTMGEWAMFGFIGLMGLVGYWVVRRKLG
ncbi:MAG: hypothetical protein Kapaf2KO_22570 [Candidatus Kapaibacteriales bacterium]